MPVKNDKEIREQIKKIVDSYKHVLDCYPATVGINAPRALMQIEAQSKLDALYWTLGEKRPRFKCDDTTKVDG